MQPTQKPMTTQPTQNEMPAEVREAIATTARALFGVGSDRDNFVAVTTEEMEAALAPLWAKQQADTARLDWLGRHCYGPGADMTGAPMPYVIYDHLSPYLRAAIDAAMKETTK